MQIYDIQCDSYFNPNLNEFKKQIDRKHKLEGEKQ